MNTPAYSSEVLPKAALTRVEAARFLGVSPSSIDRATKRGLLRPSRAFRRPLYLVEELVRFLRETSTQMEIRADGSAAL
jgi:hypothetical protein